MNPQVYAALMQARSERLQFAAESVIQEMGDEALRISKATMERLIYEHPIPTTKNGKPRWKRTRNLINRERLVVNKATLTATLVNKVRYAEVRHAMGSGAPRRKSNWPAPWRTITRDEIRKKFGPKLQSALRSILNNAASGKP